MDAARAADGDDRDQFRLMAAAAAASALPAYPRNAELNIQVHGGIGFTWGARRAPAPAPGHDDRCALLGGDGPAADVFELSAAGVTRRNSSELPASAEEMAPACAADSPRSPRWTARSSSTG